MPAVFVCCNLRSETCVQKENGARWLLVGGGLNWEEAPHRERPGCGVGRGNTMSGPRRSKSGEDRRAPLLSHLQPASSQEGLMCVCITERETLLASARSPGTNLGADTQGPGAKGQTAPGEGSAAPPSPPTAISISSLMMHVRGYILVKASHHACLGLGSHPPHPRNDRVVAKTHTGS